MYRACIVAGLALVLASGAHAGRPFVVTEDAAAEEDDDDVWAVEVVAQRLGDVRSAGVTVEYALRPTDSVEVGLGRSRDRAAGERADEAEFAYKHLWNRIGRDGWGWGTVLAFSARKAEGGSWRGDGVALRVPFTLAIGDDALLHLNAGLEKPRDERRSFGASIGYEHALPWRTTGFVEAAREDRATLLHAGVRHWIRRERIALDLSVLRERADGERRSGVVIGIGFYDL